MTDFFRRCEDGHRCENGSVCREDLNEEGSFYCDCSTAVGGKFAGLYCEYSSQRECKFSQDIEATWFCVNNGNCVVSESKWICDCPNNFKGPHCEFVDGALPSDWPVGKSNIYIQESDAALKGGVIAAIVLSVLIFVGLVGFLVWKTKFANSEGEVGQNAPRDQSEALRLDADGDVLKKAFKSMGQFTFPSTPEGDTEILNENIGVSGHLL